MPILEGKALAARLSPRPISRRASSSSDRRRTSSLGSPRATASYPRRRRRASGRTRSSSPSPTGWSRRTTRTIRSAARSTTRTRSPSRLRRAAHFTGARLPKFLGYFERLLAREKGGWLLGRSPSYVDLSLFQMIAGLRYAFPRAMDETRAQAPAVGRAARPRRLASAHRRLPRFGPAHRPSTSTASSGTTRSWTPRRNPMKNAIALLAAATPCCRRRPGLPRARDPLDLQLLVGLGRRHRGALLQRPARQARRQAGGGREPAPACRAASPANTSRTSKPDGYTIMITPASSDARQRAAPVQAAAASTRTRTSRR